MLRIIAYDVCRLFIGPYVATPRGIDRVDLAVANHLLADPDSPHLAMLPTPLGVRAYPARTARLLLSARAARRGVRGGVRSRCPRSPTGAISSWSSRSSRARITACCCASGRA